MAASQGIKLDDNTKQRLKALATQRKRTPHWLMRTAIEDYLDREEQYEKEKAEDIARWEEYLVTGSAINHETAEKWLKGLAAGKPSKWAK